MRAATVAILALSLLFGASRSAAPVVAEPYSPIKPLPKAARKHLLRYIASDDTDAFLADTLLGPRLARLLGDELPHLQRNIDVRGSVAFQSGMVYVVGNAPHQGGLEHGFVGIDVNSGHVCAALLTQGKFALYGAGTDRHAIPNALREWILATWAYVTLDGSIPADATLHDERPGR